MLIRLPAIIIDDLSEETQLLYMNTAGSRSHQVAVLLMTGMGAYCAFGFPQVGTSFALVAAGTLRAPS